MKHFLHQLINQTSKQGVVKGAGLRGDPLVEVSEELIGPERLTFFELLNPYLNHFSDVLKRFLHLRDLIK